MLVTDILHSAARRFPNRPAFSMKQGFRTLSLTYKETEEIAKKTALLLERNNVKAGEKVLILAPNTPQWACAFLGTLLRGAVPVPLNTQSTDTLVEKIKSETLARVLFAYTRASQSFPDDLLRFDLDYLFEDVERFDVRDFIPKSRTQKDLAQIMYTSGTTGDPKGVMHTHENISAAVSGIGELVPITEHDRFLSILPLSHIFEQTIGLLLPMRSGAHIVYAHSPAAIRDLLYEYRVTKLVAVPEFLKLFMDKIEAKADREGKKKILQHLFHVGEQIGARPFQRLLFRPVLSAFGGKLHTIASGGAPLDKELERKWSAMGITILQGYGLTEVSGVATANTYTDHRAASVGKPLPSLTVALSENDNEITIHGPTVFSGYFNNAEKTKEVLMPDGSFLTGDIGEFDDDGFLYIRGRKKYMILGPGGQNVYPEDIEKELNKEEGVKDSTVLGIEKEGGSLVIYAVLLPERTETSSKLNAEKAVSAVNERVQTFQRITGFSVWPEDDFPRSAARKIKKNEVKKWVLENERGREVSRGASQKISKTVRVLQETTGTKADMMTPSTNLTRDLGLDSLLRIELVARIEDTLGVLVSEAKITQDTTVKDLEKLVAEGPSVEEKAVFKTWPLHPLVSAVRNGVVQPLSRMFSRFFMKLIVEGAEHIENVKGPVLLYPNHLSILDSAPVTYALPPHIRRRISHAAARDALYQEPKWKQFLAELVFNAFPFPRKEGEHLREGLEHTGLMLDRGYSVVLFPEGDTSKDGHLLPLKGGAGFLAVEMGVPVVPVHVWGTNKIVKGGTSKITGRGEVIVRFGAPLTFSRRATHEETGLQLYNALKKLGAEHYEKL